MYGVVCQFFLKCVPHVNEDPSQKFQWIILVPRCPPQKLTPATMGGTSCEGLFFGGTKSTNSASSGHQKKQRTQKHMENLMSMMCLWLFLHTVKREVL